MLAKTSAILLITTATALAKPNIVFVLVDDMGWTGLSTAMDDRIPGSKRGVPRPTSTTTGPPASAR